MKLHGIIPKRTTLAHLIPGRANHLGPALAGFPSVTKSIPLAAARPCNDAKLILWRRSHYKGLRPYLAACNHRCPAGFAQVTVPRFTPLCHGASAKPFYGLAGAN